MQKTKVIIFDFDGTLYYGKSWCGWSNYLVNALEFILPDKDKRQAFIDRFPNYNKVHGGEFADMLKEAYGTAEKFVLFEKTHLYPLELENITPIQNDFLRDISQKVPLVVVSNSTIEHQLFYLSQFGIDHNIFSDFYQNNFDTPNGKGDYYLEIMKKYNCRPDEIVVIGDNYEFDILPALKLGMRANHINEFDDVKRVIERIIIED